MVLGLVLSRLVRWPCKRIIQFVRKIGVLGPAGPEKERFKAELTEALRRRGKVVVTQSSATEMLTNSNLGPNDSPEYAREALLMHKNMEKCLLEILRLEGNECYLVQDVPSLLEPHVESTRVFYEKCYRPPYPPVPV